MIYEIDICAMNDMGQCIGTDPFYQEPPGVEYYAVTVGRVINDGELDIIHESEHYTLAEAEAEAEKQHDKYNKTI